MQYFKLLKLPSETSSKSAKKVNMQPAIELLWSDYQPIKTAWKFLWRWKYFIVGLQTIPVHNYLYKNYYCLISHDLICYQKYSAKKVGCFNHRVVIMVANKLERQCMIIRGLPWYGRLIAQEAVAQLILWPQCIGLLSEHLWRSHYKCTSKLQ